MWEKLNIPAAYGPVLRKFQSDIIFAIFGRSPKNVTACMIMIPCIKFGGIGLKLGEEKSFKKIVKLEVKLEILQRALNDPKPNPRNQASKVPYIMCTVVH